MPENEFKSKEMRKIPLIKQYFAEVKLRENDSLSDVLSELVNEAENQYQTPFIEVSQVIQRGDDAYTVILNMDFAKHE